MRNWWFFHEKVKLVFKLPFLDENHEISQGVLMKAGESKTTSFLDEILNNVVVVFMTEKCISVDQYK